MKTALISVYNKTGIVEFAKELAVLGFKILASGRTAKVLSENGVEVTDTASLVGESILGHRVVTLSREIHAGLLAKDNKEDRAELEKLKIPFIDLVCVDLYPLEEEIAKWNTTPSAGAATPALQEGSSAARDAIIEKTDIGGPTMLRSAAKGRRIVVCDPGDRQPVIDWIKAGEPDKEKFLDALAAKAEYIVADYCLASARYHSAEKFDGIIGQQIIEAKYGENGWQQPSGLFADKSMRHQMVLDKSARYADELSLENFKLVAGTAPSYNNLADVDRLLQTVTHIAAGFDANRPINRHATQETMIAVGVKHGNPCGAAVDIEASSAIKKMLEGDLRAIFGGVVMVNFEINEELAEVLLTHRMASNTTPSPNGATPPLQEGRTARRLLDGVIAPSFTPSAIELMKRKGDKCRFLVNPALSSLNKNSLDQHTRFRYVRGGFLKQPNYTLILDLAGAEMSGNNEISEIQKSDIILAWAVGSTSNSNTVTIVKYGQLLGNGVGQQDRVGCCQLAIKRSLDAGHNIAGATAYSDSFFPFVDAVQVLSDAGVKIIFATNGSVRDEEIKKFCLEHQISLVTLPDKDARGFFGH